MHAKHLFYTLLKYAEPTYERFDYLVGEHKFALETRLRHLLAHIRSDGNAYKELAATGEGVMKLLQSADSSAKLVYGCPDPTFRPPFSFWEEH